MFGSAVLDTAIGLIFIFFIFGTMCSGAFTMISRWLDMRGKLLQQGLLMLLSADMRQQVMHHPLVESTRLKQGHGTNNFLNFLRKIPIIGNIFPGQTELVSDPRPDYIAPTTFSRTLIDIIIKAGEQSLIESLATPLPDTKLSIDELVKIFSKNIDKKEIEQQAKTQAINYVRHQLDQLIDQNEQVVIEGVDKLILELGVKDENLCDEIRFQVRSILSQRGEILELLALGLEKVPLPDKTKEFFQRQIELIKRQHGLDTKLKTAKEKLDEVVAGVENWYNRTMDSLTVIFKRASQAWIFLIATVLALFFNINTISIGQTLWTNTTVRNSVVAAANTRVEEEQQASGETEINPVEIFRRDLAALQVPVGWTKSELDDLGLPTEFAQSDDSTRPEMTPFKAIVGFGLTIIAGVMGAPFWFDLLNRLLNLRSGSKSSSKDEDSK